ncbi:MAG: helix-turn-helix domain-containing protein [Dehalococcoidales bacterium]|nr:helix-turn-helix domain-containing protein [Dehalococcoidales bacterium]
MSISQKTLLLVFSFEGGEPRSLAEFTHKLNIKRDALAKTVWRLEKKGLVKRKPGHPARFYREETMFIEFENPDGTTRRIGAEAYLYLCQRSIEEKLRKDPPRVTPELLDAAKQLLAKMKATEATMKEHLAAKSQGISDWEFYYNKVMKFHGKEVKP